MPLAVAQLGHVQEHPQELQWTFSSPENLNRAPVRMEMKFSSGTPVNPLHLLKILGKNWQVMVESDNRRKLSQHHPWPALRGDPISRTNWSEQGCRPGWGSLQGSDCQSTRSQASPPVRLGGCHAASVASVGLLPTGRRQLQVSSLHTVD